MVEQELIRLLVCPQTGGALIWHEPTSELISLAARCAYPVKDGVPMMIKDSARPLTEEEYESFK